MPNAAKFVPVLIIIFLLVVAGSRCVKVIPAGHVGVATLFGKVKEQPYDAGFHVVNPLLGWQLFDARQKTHKEQAEVPSQDQLTTTVDVSVQYRIIGPMAPEIYKDTGNAAQAVEVHLIPKVRSVLREQGKSIKRAEDFFLEETQQQLQVSLQAELEDFLQSKGIEVNDVLIRDIKLPDRLVAQIQQKKETEQQAERQKAELIRYETEQQQQVVKEQADTEAARFQAEKEILLAEAEAKKRTLIADAQAYEIEAINKAISENPAYIKLQALEALKAISKDPASKVYFLDGDSPAPLPLMNLGDAEPVRR